MLLCSFPVAALAALGLTASAHATTFVAAPDATRTQAPCTTDTPCSLPYAAGQAFSDEDVTLLKGGTYTLDKALVVTAGTIRGMSSRPLITGRGLSIGEAAAAEHLELRDTGFSGLVLAGRASDIIAGSPKTGEPAVQMLPGGFLRDSVAEKTGTFGVAIDDDASAGASTATARLLNVTAVASGGQGVAIRVRAKSSFINGKCETAGARLSIRNVIARADMGDDLQAVTTETSEPCPHSVAVMDVDHTNFRKADHSPYGLFVMGAGNQTTAALTEHVLSDDGVHQLAGSPTIDAGSTDPDLGPVDIDGNPVPGSKAPDIGGDEFLAPVLADPPVAPTAEPTTIPTATPTTTPTATPTTTPVATPSSPNLIAVHAKNRVTRTRLRHAGLRVLADLRRPGTVTAHLTATVKGHTVPLADGTSAAGTTAVRLRPSRRALTRLGHHRRVHATLTVAVTGGGDLPETRTLSISIRPKRSR